MAKYCVLNEVHSTNMLGSHVDGKTLQHEEDLTVSSPLDYLSQYDLSHQMRRLK